MPINRHTNRRIQLTIYKLKRLYGGPIWLYRVGQPQTDLDTGIKTWPGRSRIRVQRAVILPVKLSREQTQTISIISANKAFVYGGFYDLGSRLFLVDPRDLPPGYQIKMDDFIVYDGKQYEIKNIVNTEFNALWEITATELEGVSPHAVLLDAEDTINLTQTNDREVS